MSISEQTELDAALNFRSPKLTQFLTYWQDKKGDRLFPARADIVPREIQPWLPMISMYDVPAPGDAFRIRLIGTALNDLLGGGDLRAKPVSALPPLVHERKLHSLNTVMQMRAPLRTIVGKTVIPGQDFQSLEACYAPLSSNGSDIDVIIALMQLGARSN